jgi:predicted DNA-binding transcriptional regulator YafY
MNRTDRLLAIVLELQRKGTLRAQDLAVTFEVSTRTMYRDLQALSEAGVPIIAVQKKGYSLPEGYFLPPLRFTTEEALILALGCDFMGHSFDDQYRAVAEAASRKIDTVLPETLRQEVSYLSTNISFFAADPLSERQRDHLRLLRSAMAECRTIHFRYTQKKVASSEVTLRAVDPYSLARLAGDWLLMGYCHLRQALRVFRLGRMDQLTMLEKWFERPTDFHPDWIAASEQREVVVTALFDQEAAHWVQESRPFSAVAAEQTPQGFLLTLRVRDERDIFQWLLSWGKHVQVISPESLRTRMRQEIAHMAEKY